MSGNSKNEKKKDKYTAIREVLRAYSSKEHPLKMKAVSYTHLDVYKRQNYSQSTI